MALKKNNIVAGINSEKLIELINNPVYNRNILIAQGSVPINGINGSYVFNFATQKSFKPKEREDGTVDFNDISFVQNVIKGQVLCTIKLHTDGIEGFTVTGEKLPCEKGKPVSNLVGKNTELSEDGTVIYSTIDGHVEFNGTKIYVNETLYIQEDVDNSTGNIKVNGNVVVRGMVLAGFCVEAGGNIEISGTVESAVLKAGGKIILRSGIIGSELHCNGDLSSRFIEDCNVTVKGDVKAEYIMSSNITCGKSIKIVGAIAKIVGGSCIAGKDIETRTIGTLAGV